MKTCISCGMPMQRPEEFALGDESKDYCVHCAHPDGSMRSYEEALEGMTAFMVRTQGLDQATAQVAVSDALSRLPAWKDRYSTST